MVLVLVGLGVLEADAGPIRMLRARPIRIRPRVIYVQPLPNETPPKESDRWENGIPPWIRYNMPEWEWYMRAV